MILYKYNDQEIAFPNNLGLGEPGRPKIEGWDPGRGCGIVATTPLQPNAIPSFGDGSA